MKYLLSASAVKGAMHHSVAIIGVYREYPGGTAHTIRNMSVLLGHFRVHVRFGDSA